MLDQVLEHDDGDADNCDGDDDGDDDDGDGDDGDGDGDHLKIILISCVRFNVQTYSSQELPGVH